MPQISRTTSGMETVDAVALQATIDGLLVSMQPGNSITAADINALITAYNDWITHTHSTTDLVGQDTFGDISTYGPSGLNLLISTTAATDVISTLFSNQTLTVAVDQEIDSAHQLAMRLDFIDIKMHRHNIFDTTS